VLISPLELRDSPRRATGEISSPGTPRDVFRSADFLKAELVNHRRLQATASEPS